MFTVLEGRVRTAPRRLPIVPAVAVAAFVAVAVAVERGGRLVGLDHRIAAWLTGHRSAPVGHLAVTVANLGEPTRAPLLLLALGVLLSGTRRSWVPVRTAGVAVATLSVVVPLAKNAFGRVGPGGPVDPTGTQGGLLDVLHRGAFPSGHTTTAVVTWSVAVVLIRGRLGRAGAALVGAIGLLVGWALVYAGFHWFSDVLAAYPFAVALTWLVLRISGPRAGRANRADPDESEGLEPMPVTTRSRACA